MVTLGAGSRSYPRTREEVAEVWSSPPLVIGVEIRVRGLDADLRSRLERLPWVLVSTFGVPSYRYP